jgi:hypothetical protein
MLRIRDWQMEALGQKAAQRFVTRMARYLCDAFSRETEGMSTEAAEAWVLRNVQRAAAHGIDTEPEVAQYLLLALALGEEAPDRLPWFREVLMRTDLIAPGKAQALVRAARVRDIPDLDRFVMTPFAIEG